MENFSGNFCTLYKSFVITLSDFALISLTRIVDRRMSNKCFPLLSPLLLPSPSLSLDSAELNCQICIHDMEQNSDCCCYSGSNSINQSANKNDDADNSSNISTTSATAVANSQIDAAKLYQPCPFRHQLHNVRHTVHCPHHSSQCRNLHFASQSQFPQHLHQPCVSSFSDHHSQHHHYSRPQHYHQHHSFQSPLVLAHFFVILLSLVTLSHQQLRAEFGPEIGNIQDLPSGDFNASNFDAVGSTARSSIAANDSSIDNECNESVLDSNFTRKNNFPGIIEREIGWDDYFKIILYVCTILAALVGNAAVVFAVSNKRSTVNMYLANLAVADILICVCCMWVHLVNNLTSPQYVLGQLWCKINGYAQMTCLTSSVLTLSAISCDRYMAIMFPFRSRVTKKRTDAVIILIWIFSLLISVPFFIYRRFQVLEWNDYIEPNCMEVWPTIKIFIPNSTVPEILVCVRLDYYKQVYYTLVSTTLFFVPVFIMLTAYSAIIWKLWVNKVPGEVNYANIRAQKKSKRKVIKMVIVILLAFIVCWLPLQITLVYSIYVHSAGELPEWFSNISYYATFIAYSNSAFNPLIYGGFNKNFREALCNQSPFCAMLWWKKGRSLSRQQYSTKSLSTIYSWINRESQMSRSSHHTHNTLVNNNNNSKLTNGSKLNHKTIIQTNGTKQPQPVGTNNGSINSIILVDLQTETFELEPLSEISHL